MNGVVGVGYAAAFGIGGGYLFLEGGMVVYGSLSA